MVQLPQENSIFTRTVRRAAGEDRLSHAVILTGRGDLTAAARFLAAAHVCEGTDRLTARQLLGLCAASQRFAEQCDQNAGVGQILGALAVKWEELL